MTAVPLLAARAGQRAVRWRGAWLALWIAACAGVAASAHAFADGRGASSIALDAAGAGAAYSLAERDSASAAQWTEESRVAAYLRLHYASDAGVVALYPLAAFAAVTQRTDLHAGGLIPGGPYAYTRRAVAGPGDGGPQVR